MVITNIRGIRTAAEIADELGETFPDGAEIWRVTTTTPETIELMRNWYNWAPCGALIIIDEIQKVFNKSKGKKGDSVLTSFNPADYNHRPVSDFAEILPPHYIERFHSAYADVNRSARDLAVYDDLGNGPFDSDGNLRYPATFADAFMEHRHYNWDVVCCTPQITRVHDDMRDVCEVAFSHVSKEVVAKLIPYFDHRPRVLQHKPQTNGVTPAKGEIISFPKIPVRVHDFYQSTITGKHSRGAKQGSPFRNPKFIFGMVFIVFAVVFQIWFWFFSDGQEAIDEASTSISPSVNVVTQAPSVSVTHEVQQVNFGGIADLKLPWSISGITYTGYVQRCDQHCRYTYFFELSQGPITYSIDSDTLRSVGVESVFKTDCMVELRRDGVRVPIACGLNPSLPEVEKKEVQTISVSSPLT